MKQIPLTQGKFAIVDDEDYAFLTQWNWWYSKCGYACRTVCTPLVNGKRRKRAIPMHRIIAGTPDGFFTDHINGDGLDNRKKNLRICDKGQNAINTPIKKRGKKLSKYRGVLPSSTTGWKAKIKKDQKFIHLGTFDREEDAALAYNAAAVKLFGEFARLNSVGKP